MDVSDSGDLLLGNNLLLRDDDSLLGFPLSFFPEVALLHLGVVVSVLALQLINLIEEPLHVDFIFFLELNNNGPVLSLNVFDLDVLGTGR